MTAAGRDPKLHAAVAYFAYGLIYMIGALAELDDSRKVDFFAGTTPWWAFYVLGGVFLVALPILVWRGVRWLMAVLAFFTALKAGYLCFRLGREFAPFDLVFAAAAALAAVLLLRAFRRTAPSQAAGSGAPST